MRYRDWVTVRKAIENKEGELHEQTWNLLREYLMVAATHPPCDDEDIEYACKKLRTLRGVMNQKRLDDLS